MVKSGTKQGGGGGLCAVSRDAADSKLRLPLLGLLGGLGRDGWGPWMSPGFWVGVGEVLCGSRAGTLIKRYRRCATGAGCWELRGRLPKGVGTSTVGY